LDINQVSNFEKIFANPVIYGQKCTLQKKQKHSGVQTVSFDENIKITVKNSNDEALKRFFGKTIKRLTTKWPKTCLRSNGPR
jgi:hypothetical protein